MRWIAFLLLLSFNAYGQEVLNFEKEELVLHTDRSLYSSGELIWFKIYVFKANQTDISTFSKVAYIDLIDQKGIALSSLKIELQAGKGNGFIVLPSSLNSGAYTLRAYTQALRNFGPEAFASSSLFLIQPGQALIQAEENQEQRAFLPEQNAKTFDSSQNLNIQLDGIQSQYPQRTLVEIEVQTPEIEELSEFSIAVVKKAPLSPSPFKSFESQSKPNEKTEKVLAFISEDKGLTFNGKLFNTQNGAAVAGADIFLSFPGERSLVYNKKTDSKGAFSFLLPKMYGLQEAVVQYIPIEKVPLSLEIDNGFEKQISTKDTNVILSGEAWKAYAKAIQTGAQIGKAYLAFEAQVDYLAPDIFKQTSFFGKAEHQYFLDDYARFPLPEFFYEVVPQVKVRGSFGEERLAVLNDWHNLPDEMGPLLLVDGVPVLDEKKFLQINNKLIKSAEIITKPIWLNPQVFNGMIQVSSFDGDARCIELGDNAIRRTFLAYSPARRFWRPNYDEQANRKVPDFSNTLYWNPSLRTNENGTAKFSFYTADGLGSYEIIVTGLSQSGKLSTKKAVFEVIR